MGISLTWPITLRSNEIQWTTGKGQQTRLERTSLTENKTFLLNGSRSVDWDLCFPSPLNVRVCLQELTWRAFKMQQSSTAGVKLFVCVRVCLTMTCLGLKQQSICFHGLRQVCHQPWLLLCFILGWLSDYEHPKNAFKTCCLLPSVSTLNIPKRPTACNTKHDLCKQFL